MVSPDDTTLLREWTARRSEAAFRTLMERYAGLVHGTALRRLHREDWAAEAAQDAFLLLARKAPRLNGSGLGAWLHRTTLFTASSLLKKETRHARRAHAWAGDLPRHQPGDDAAGPAAELDAALDELPDSDRALLLLRYYENCTAAQAAAHLGLTAEAVQKRTERALKRLAARLHRKVPGAAAGVLAGGLAAQLSQGAPPGFVTAALPHVFAAGPAAAGIPFLTALATMKTPHAVLLTALLTLIPAVWLTAENHRLQEALTAAATPASTATEEAARSAETASRPVRSGGPRESAAAAAEVNWDALGEDDKVAVELSRDTILRSDLPALANDTQFTLSEGVRELLRITDAEARRVETALRNCELEIKKIDRSKIQRVEELPNGMVFKVPAFPEEGKPLRDQLFAEVTAAVGARRAAFLLPKIAAATDWRLARFGVMERQYRVEFQEDQPVIEADGTRRSTELLTTRIDFMRGDALVDSEIMENDGEILAPIATKHRGTHVVLGEIGGEGSVPICWELSHLFTIEDLKK